MQGAAAEVLVRWVLRLAHWSLQRHTKHIQGMKLVMNDLKERIRMQTFLSYDVGGPHQGVALLPAVIVARLVAIDWTR